MPILDRAACAGMSTRMFFPVPGRGHEAEERHAADVERAQAVCARCPQVLACLGWALRHREHGVWGGTTDEQRDALRTAGWGDELMSDARGAWR